MLSKWQDLRSKQCPSLADRCVLIVISHCSLRRANTEQRLDMQTSTPYAWEHWERCIPMCLIVLVAFVTGCTSFLSPILEIDILWDHMSSSVEQANSDYEQGCILYRDSLKAENNAISFKGPELDRPIGMWSTVPRTSQQIMNQNHQKYNGFGQSSVCIQTGGIGSLSQPMPIMAGLTYKYRCLLTVIRGNRKIERHIFLPLPKQENHESSSTHRSLLVLHANSLLCPEGLCGFKIHSR